MRTVPEATMRQWIAQTPALAPAESAFRSADAARWVLDAAAHQKPDLFRKLVQDSKLEPERLSLFAFLLGAYASAVVDNARELAGSDRRLEQIEFDEATGTLVAHRLLTEQGLSQLLAWQSGKVDLTGKPLFSALDELGRYQPTEVTFAYQDKDMRQMRIGGLVVSTNMDDFLDWLALKHGIQHKRTSGAHGAEEIHAGGMVDFDFEEGRIKIQNRVEILELEGIAMG